MARPLTCQCFFPSHNAIDPFTTMLNHSKHFLKFFLVNQDIINSKQHSPYNLSEISKHEISPLARKLHTTAGATGQDSQLAKGKPASSPHSQSLSCSLHFSLRSFHTLFQLIHYLKNYLRCSW